MRGVDLHPERPLTMSEAAAILTAYERGELASGADVDQVEELLAAAAEELTDALTAQMAPDDVAGVVEERMVADTAFGAPATEATAKPAAPPVARPRTSPEVGRGPGDRATQQVTAGRCLRA